MFLLLEYCHITYSEFWDIPIELRKWLIERKKKELEKAKEAQDKAAHKRTANFPAPKRAPRLPR